MLGARGFARRRKTRMAAIGAGLLGAAMAAAAAQAEGMACCAGLEPGVARLEALQARVREQTSPMEIAAAIDFLLGPGASYIHGSILYADGGNDAEMMPDRF